MKFYSCNHVQHFYLKFAGHISDAQLRYCCIPVKDKLLPNVLLTKNYKKNLNGLIELRKSIIHENMAFSSPNPPSERKFTKTCADCRFYRLAEWGESSTITDVEFGMYPAPCQSWCVYCGVAHGENRKKFFHFDEQEHGEYYEAIFGTLQYAKRTRLLSNKIFWKISSGEYSVHPYKKEIADLIGCDAAMWYTNAFVYDDYIATNLKANPNSLVYVSIDCGTAETWEKVKGHDNFHNAMDNLIDYSCQATHPNQIYLKYIVLPEINDNEADITNFVEIIKIFKANRVEISPNEPMAFNDGDYGRKTVIATAKLLSKLHANNIQFYWGRFPQNMQNEVIEHIKSM